MCRIAGIISPGLSSDEIAKKVKLMCTALQHGGPDDEGIFVDDERHLGLGQRRLSIIDLSNNGHQPMADVDEKAWITFNGEIYNYLEIKKELLTAGAKFRSSTDTEVIIQAYLCWGTAAFEKLNGMFAFALYDKAKNITYLVRDTGGIKPLYYCADKGQLNFASEVRAFKAAGLAIEPDKNWQVRFLAYGHIPEPHTTLKNVYSLPKGHFLCWDNAKATFTLTAYNTSTNKISIFNADDAREQIAKILAESVSRQLIADAPIGVFLSGGVDSSLITLLANQQKHTALKTISIHFDEKAYDESAFQKIIRDKIEGEKFDHLVKQRDFEECFPQILSAMDMPTTDGINTWFISKYAQQDGLKAVLSGIGADELYGGYPSFNRIQYLKYLRSVPAALFSLAMPLLADQYKKLEFLKYNNPAADYLFLRALFSPSAIADILDTDVKQVADILFSGDDTPTTKVYDKPYASKLETNFYMQNQLLRDTDVMSMNHGLEVRVPFLDELFINLTNQISPELRFSGQPKKLLTDSFKDLLPKEIWNRPKMGFSFPLQKWMQQNRHIGDENLYRSKTGKKIIKKFKNNKLHWSKCFALYQLQAHE
ncbi:MAG: asparagine synthase (glutamine-hydrolyzing) [Sphingobacteriales bacterium]